MNAGPKTHSSAKPRPGSPMKLAPSRSATATVLKKQAALNKALQDKQATTQGRADGGRNSSNSITIAKGPESQSCKGCGFVGGSWKSCRRNDKRSAAAKVHEDGPGSPGKRRATAQKNSDVYAARLGRVVHISQRSAERRSAVRDPHDGPPS